MKPFPTLQETRVNFVLRGLGFKSNVGGSRYSLLASAISASEAKKGGSGVGMRAIPRAK